jgi:hypothetical protein
MLKICLILIIDFTDSELTEVSENLESICLFLIKERNVSLSKIEWPALF